MGGRKTKLYCVEIGWRVLDGSCCQHEAPVRARGSNTNLHSAAKKSLPIGWYKPSLVTKSLIIVLVITTYITQRFSWPQEEREVHELVMCKYRSQPYTRTKEPLTSYHYSPNLYNKPKQPGYLNIQYHRGSWGYGQLPASTVRDIILAHPILLGLSSRIHDYTPLVPYPNMPLWYLHLTLLFAPSTPRGLLKGLMPSVLVLAE